MSVEFFTKIEQVEKLAKSIKFLDGSFPAIGDKYESRVEQIRSELESLDGDLKKDLARFVKTSKGKQGSTKTRRTKPKAV
jgi:hypothetical protein